MSWNPRRFADQVRAHYTAAALNLDVMVPTEEGPRSGHSKVAFADHTGAPGVAVTAYKRVADVVRVLRETAV